MSYVPPHLRGKGGSSGAPETSDARPDPGFGRTNSTSSFGRSGSQSQFPSAGSSSNLTDYGRGVPRSGSFARAPSYGDVREPRRGREPVEAKFPEWKPSERVQALTTEQIVDIRQRLNVQVTDDPDMPPAVAPIESFKDMVRPRAGRRRPPRGCTNRFFRPGRSPGCSASRGPAVAHHHHRREP